jgi:hypothetical protein
MGFSADFHYEPLFNYINMGYGGLHQWDISTRIPGRAALGGITTGIHYGRQVGIRAVNYISMDAIDSCCGV